MSEVVREIEGEWEVVRRQDAYLSGKRVRLQVLRGSPADATTGLRALLKETQARAAPVTDDEIDGEIEAVRNNRACAS